jgi:hypothetical protein
VSDNTRIRAHDQVECGFDDVLGALRARLPSEVGPSSRLGSDFAHRGMARFAVQIDGVDASLLVFRLVGGTQAPVTEIAVASTDERETSLPASASRRFLDDVMVAIDNELRAGKARRAS